MAAIALSHQVQNGAPSTSFQPDTTPASRQEMPKRGQPIRHSRGCGDPLNVRPTSSFTSGSCVPIKLTVALLIDRHGVIDSNLPVTVTLDDLDSPAQAKIKAVGKAQAERPQLKIQLPITAVPGLDREAIIEARLRPAIAASIWIRPCLSTTMIRRRSPATAIQEMVSVCTRRLRHVHHGAECRRRQKFAEVSGS